MEVLVKAEVLELVAGQEVVEVLEVVQDMARDSVLVEVLEEALVEQLEAAEVEVVETEEAMEEGQVMVVDLGQEVVLGVEQEDLVADLEEVKEPVAG